MNNARNAFGVAADLCVGRWADTWVRPHVLEAPPAPRDRPAGRNPS
jgi:hypothetical protein